MREGELESRKGRSKKKDEGRRVGKVPTRVVAAGGGTHIHTWHGMEREGTVEEQQEDLTAWHQ